MACHVILTFVVVNHVGLFYGFFHNCVVLSLLYWIALQSRISDHFSRIYVGTFYGFILCFFGDFLFNIRPFISRTTVFSFFLNATAVLYLGYRFSVQKPAYSKAESQSEVCQKIVDSSPSEGTDFENNLLISDLNLSKIQIVKDSFTGKVKVVRSKNDQSNTTEIRVRTWGPCLCGRCGCDKCVIHIPASLNPLVDLKLGKNFPYFIDVTCYICSLLRRSFRCITLQFLRLLYIERRSSLCLFRVCFCCFHS
jgi:hypothetical protein